MAQALFAAEAKRRSIDCEVKSAGLAAFTGSPASDNSVAVLKEIGIDIMSFRSTALSAVISDEFDLYVPMTYSQAIALVNIGIEKSKIYLFKNEVTDPYGGSIDTYRKTRDEIAENVKMLADFVESKLGGGHK